MGTLEASAARIELVAADMDMDLSWVDLSLRLLLPASLGRWADSEDLLPALTTVLVAAVSTELCSARVNDEGEILATDERIDCADAVST